MLDEPMMNKEDEHSLQMISSVIEDQLRKVHLEIIKLPPLDLDLLEQLDPELHKMIVDLYSDKIVYQDGKRLLFVEDFPVNDILILNERGIIKISDNAREGLEEIN